MVSKNKLCHTKNCIILNLKTLLESYKMDNIRCLQLEKFNRDYNLLYADWLNKQVHLADV